MKTYTFEYYQNNGIYYHMEVKLTKGQDTYNHFLNWYNTNPHTRGLRKVK